jgi:hypothetical protein
LVSDIPTGTRNDNLFYSVWCPHITPCLRPGATAREQKHRPGNSPASDNKKQAAKILPRKSR